MIVTRNDQSSRNLPCDRPSSFFLCKCFRATQIAPWFRSDRNSHLNSQHAHHIEMPLLRNESRSSPDSIYPAGSASNIDITDVNAMGRSEHKGLLVGRAKKPDTISLAVRSLKFSWGALIFHSFSRRSSLFLLYSARHPTCRRRSALQHRAKFGSEFGARFL